MDEKTNHKYTVRALIIIILILAAFLVRSESKRGKLVEENNDMSEKIAWYDSCLSEIDIVLNSDDDPKEALEKIQHSVNYYWEGK